MCIFHYISDKRCLRADEVVGMIIFKIYSEVQNGCELIQAAVESDDNCLGNESNALKEECFD